MQLKSIILLLSVIVAVLVITSIAITIYFIKREHRLLHHIQNMLDDAVSGAFIDKKLDESKLSAIENSMWRYLCDSKVSYVNIADEKAKIQTLISDISHQTITPISNMMIYSQLLEEWYYDKNSQKNQDVIEEISSVREEAEKLDFLVQSLVKLSRMETGIITVNAKEQSIEPVLRTIERQFQAKANQKQIHFHVETSEEKAHFDQKWTIEAIGNIVDNAMKYTGEGGTVNVSIEPYSMFLRINIMDTGIGIAESEQGNIFTRFYRSASVNEKPGVGIGLYLAREVIKAQDGYIKLESKLGEGSKFSIFLLCEETSQN